MGRKTDGVAKAPKVRKIRESKKKTTAAEALAAGTQPETARITTFKPNGGTSAAIPSAEVSTGLGPVELPSPEDSVRVLAELADLNDKALVAFKKYEELKGHTKAAKDKYDELVARVSARLRQATHKSDLPLFADIEKREADQAAMERGNLIPPPAQDAAPDAPAAAPEGEPTAGQGEGAEVAETAPAAPETEMPPDSHPEAQIAIPDDDVPF